MRFRLRACAAVMVALGSAVAPAAEPARALAEPIAPQALDGALKLLIAQTGLNLIYVSGDVRGRRSAVVPAGLGGLDALRRLLAGSGLEVQVLTASTVRIVPARRGARGAAAAAGDLAGDPIGQGEPARTPLDEIIVTATKREEPLGRVPVSVLVLDPADVTPAGLGGIADLASAAPGFAYTYDTEFGSVLLTHTVLRGISTDKGSATLGVTLGDTPLQMPLNPFRTPFPLGFDMQRIELLRGPQATFFGTDTMGGSIRFIPATASIGARRVKAWVESSANVDGGVGGGAAVQADVPLVPGVLGAHIALLQQREPGYVDRVSPLDGTVHEANANHVTARIAHLALVWQPSDTWRVEPDAWYQSTHLHDTPVYYVRGMSTLPDPTFSRDSSNTVNGKLLDQPTDERMWRLSLKSIAAWEHDTLELQAAWFERDNYTLVDQTNSACATFFGTCGSPLGPAYPTSPGQAVYTPITQEQALASLEAKLTGARADERLSWLLGATFRDLHTDLADDTWANAFPGGAVEFERDWYVVRELGAYGQLRVRLAPRWSLGVGTRIGQMNGETTRYQGSVIDPNVTPYAHFVSSRSSQKSNPRVDLGYQARPGAYYYLGVAKGTREGGINYAASCAGVPTPDHYGSDAVWNYELGGKLAAPDGHVALNGSVFYIRWNGVQDQLHDACGNTYTANVGAAVSRGFDVDFEWRGHRWDAQATLGWVDARFTRTVRDGAGQVVALDGAVLGAFPTLAPPWSGRLAVRYRAPAGWYARADGRFQTRNFGPYTGFAPDAAEPLPASARPDPGAPRFSLLGGRVWGPWDARLVIDNLTDRQPRLQTNFDAPGSTLAYASTWAPLTVRLRLSWQR